MANHQKNFEYTRKTTIGCRCDKLECAGYNIGMANRKNSP